MTQEHPSSGITDLRYERRIMGAWERFVQGGGLAPGAVPEVVGRSWLRCRYASVDPALVHAPDPLAEQALMALQQRHRELIEASVPIMTQARDLLSESGTMMILTDPTGVILQTEGDPATLEGALDVRLTAGASWNELLSGTNAIGAALSSGAPVRVHGAEHFCAGIKPWTCSATPVRDPATGDLLGVVDISGLRDTFNRHWLALAVSAAGRVEERLKARELELRQRLLEWGLRHLSRATPGGLLFFDRKGRLTAADARSRAAVAGMGLDPDLKAYGRIDGFSMDSVSDLSQAMLPEWLRAEWVEPVVVLGERLGTIVVLPGPSATAGIWESLVTGASSGRRSDDSFAVASIAHEVQQPLTAVVANAGASLRWLKHEPPNLAEAREGLERIIREGRRAGEIVGSIRGLVKKSPPQKEPLDLNETILGVIALTRSETQNHHVSLETRLSPRLPTVLADRVQVQQVILNLIRNALESMSGSDGPRELHVGSRTADASQVIVEVKDTGKGLDPATAERMFDPFYTTKPEGMGIGLAISRSMIEAHGGTLWAMQNSPRGAIFLFSLPAGSSRD
jgi:signal transduction histidine kinase